MTPAPPHLAFDPAPCITCLATMNGCTTLGCCAGTIAERGEEAVYKRAGIVSQTEEAAQPSGVLTPLRSHSACVM